MRFWLRIGDCDFELHEGETLIGRSERCQVVLDDPLVSRRHGVFVVAPNGVELQDLGSANGIAIDGERLEGTCMLKGGERITMGRQELKLFCADSKSSKYADTQRKRLGARTLKREPEEENFDSDAEATRTGNMLDMLGGVAEKALAVGRGKEAERILQRALHSILDRARRGVPLEPEVADRSAMFAVRLASATQQGEWFDYTMELFGAIRRVLPAQVVELLYESMRSIPEVNMRLFHTYLELLASMSGELSPNQRFLVRRIEGLEKLFGANR